MYDDLENIDHVSLSILAQIFLVIVTCTHMYLNIFFTKIVFSFVQYTFLAHYLKLYSVIIQEHKN